MGIPISGATGHNETQVLEREHDAGFSPVFEPPPTRLHLLLLLHAQSTWQVALRKGSIRRQDDTLCTHLVPLPRATTLAVAAAAANVVAAIAAVD